MLVLITLAWATPPDVDGPLKGLATAPGDAAVVIGLEDYAFLPDVPYARRDAAAMRTLLASTRGIPPDRITVLEQANREMILSAVETAGQSVGSEDTVWVYYAGHGAADPADGERMILGDDTRADPSVFASRAVRLSELEDAATLGGGGFMAILDTCYSGAGRDGDELLPGTRFAVPNYALETGPESVVWTATAENELSGPLETTDHGAFTYFVIGALRGWADGELDGTRDGEVTTSEAQAYVTRALRLLGDRVQTPKLSGPSRSLTAAREKGPELSEIDWTPAGTSEPTTVEIQDKGDLALDDLKRTRTGRPSMIAAAKDRLQEEWSEVYKLGRNGSDEGREALHDFIALYEYGYSVQVGDKRVSLEVEQVDMARAWLQHYGTAEPSTFATPATFQRVQKRHERKVRRSPTGAHWTQWAIAADGGYNLTARGAGGGGGIDLLWVPDHSGPLVLGVGARIGLYSTKNSGMQIGERLLPTAAFGICEDDTCLLGTAGAGITGLSVENPRPVTELALGWQGMDLSDEGGLVVGLRLVQQQLWTFGRPQHITGLGAYIGSFRGTVYR